MTSEAVVIHFNVVNYVTLGLLPGFIGSRVNPFLFSMKQKSFQQLRCPNNLYPILADAILDRLAHNVHTIKFKKRFDEKKKASWTD